jgi:hypothetical protein
LVERDERLAGKPHSAPHSGMGKIDDPLDQIESQHRETEFGMLSTVLNVAAPLLELANPAVGALGAIVAFAEQFRVSARQEARAEAFRQGFLDELKDVRADVNAIKQKVAGPAAEEAVVNAVRGALSSARLDKARRFGQLIGGTIAQTTPNWSEAGEFIRTLEEFSDDDFAALEIMWRVQRSAQRSEDGVMQMSTDPNDYTNAWNEVMQRAKRKGIRNDDLQARCARLSAFGLAVAVQRNDVRVGKDDICYRLTGRVVRLRSLLGLSVAPNPFPSVRYHATKPPVTVKDEDEDKALGEGWADTPAAFQKA